MNYQTLLSQALRSCPNIYPEPVDVAVAMMGGRGGFEWGPDGELQPAHPMETTPMDYADLDEAEARERQSLADGPESMRSFHAAKLLEDRAERARRNFFDENMQTIVEGSPVATYFRNEYHLSKSARELVRGEQSSYEKCAFLYFPDNITPQWGDVVRQFQDWVELRMNHEFGVSASGLNNHWPEPAKLLKHKIEASRARLHPLMNNGQDYQDYLRESQELSRRLIEEMLAEERLENAAVPAQPRRRGP